MRSGLQDDVQNDAGLIVPEDQSIWPIVISIGSNLAGPFGTPLQSCRRAVEALAALPVLRLIGQSDWYDTEPVPKSMQPNFVNGVATFLPRGGLNDPAVLLRALQSIETEAARERGERDAARTLDLDVIAMGSLVRAAPDPVLPHPRAHLRRFVLEPLRDAMPGWVHPVLHQDVSALLAALPPNGTRRLAAGGRG